MLQGCKVALPTLRPDTCNILTLLVSRLLETLTASAGSKAVYSYYAKKSCSLLLLQIFSSIALLRLWDITSALRGQLRSPHFLSDYNHCFPACVLSIWYLGFLEGGTIEAVSEKASLQLVLFKGYF